MNFKDVRVGQVFVDRVAPDLFVRNIVTYKIPGEYPMHILNANGFTIVITEDEWPEYIRLYKPVKQFKNITVRAK